MAQGDSNEGFRVSAALMGLRGKTWPFLGFPKFTLPVNLKCQGRLFDFGKAHIVFPSHFSKTAFLEEMEQFQNWNKGRDRGSQTDRKMMS